MLARTVGTGNVIARVSVNLNTKAETKLDEVFDPDGAVPGHQPLTKIKQPQLKHRHKVMLLAWGKYSKYSSGCYKQDHHG